MKPAYHCTHFNSLLLIQLNGPPTFHVEFFSWGGDKVCERSEQSMAIVSAIKLWEYNSQYRSHSYKLSTSIRQHIYIITLIEFNLNVVHIFYLLEIKFCLFTSVFDMVYFSRVYLNIGHYGGTRRP